jgi:hypothetical protein
MVTDAQVEAACRVYSDAIARTTGAPADYGMALWDDPRYLDHDKDRMRKLMRLALEAAAAA